MQLTKNFKLDEFLNSKFYDIDEQCEVFNSYEESCEVLFCNIERLARNLQVLRDYLGKPIKINIAYRPVWYEKKQGRPGTSQHCLGYASDIRVKGLKPSKVINAIEHLILNGQMEQGGLGSYDTFTHYDIGKDNIKRRWDYTSKDK